MVFFKLFGIIIAKAFIGYEKGKFIDKNEYHIFCAEFNDYWCIKS